MISVFDQGPFDPCPAPFNLAHYVLSAGQAAPDRLAVSVLGGDPADTMTYGALRAAVLGTATGLREMGLAPGDKVLMRLGNTPDFPIAYLAAIAADLLPVPTSAALTETEVGQIVAELAPRLILRDPDVASALGAPEMGVHTLRTLRTRAAWDITPGDPERLAYIVYTSGTSGKPRPVGHAHRAIWARRMMFEGWYGLRSDDRMLHAGAFNWTYTLGTGLLDPWTKGATALIPRAGTPPRDLGAMLADSKATLFAAAPGVYRQMLKSDTLPPLPHLRHGLSAGEKMPPSLHAAWQAQTGTPVYEAYGMSECSTFVSSCPDAPCPATSLGRPQPGRKVAILGEKDPVPQGDTGNIAVHGSDPGLMLGYVGAEDETAARMRGEWFLTGDLGSMDADGHITFHGRADDMMNAGGYRVSPIEVEEAVTTVPGVNACGAAEITLEPGKSIIVAFYVSADNIDENTLTSIVADRLARYKQPRAYVRLPVLPTGPNGKLLRRRLHQFWSPQQGESNT